VSEGSLAYSNALSGALWDTALAEPDWVWSYRGVSLRRAAVCEGYFALRDVAELEEAFHGRGTAPRQRTPFLDAALRRILPRGALAPPASLGRARGLARAGAASLKHLAKRAEALAGSRGAPGEPILIEIRDPKFIRTLAPALAHLEGQFCFGLSALTPSERELLEGPLRAQGWPTLDVPLGRYALPGLAGPQLWREPRLCREFDHYLAELEAVSPRALVVVEGNGRHDSLAMAAARSRGVRTLCLQHGWPPRLHAAFRRFDELDRFLCWGPGFGRLLVPMTPGLQTSAVGNPLVPEAPRESVAMGRAPVFFLQPTGHGISWEALDGFVHLVEACAERGPVEVRAHPSYPPPAEVMTRLEALPSLRWRNAPEPLSEVLAGARLTVAIHSTTIHESVAAGILPLVFNPDGLPRLQPDVVAAGAGLEATGVAEAVALVTRACEDPEWLETHASGLEAFRADYFSAGGQAAAAGTAAALAQAAGLA
jgi:hypothetical protein